MSKRIVEESCYFWCVIGKLTKVRGLVVLAAVVGLGILVLHADTSFSHEGHRHGRPRSPEAVEAAKGAEEVAVNPDEAPIIEFDHLEHDFGTIYSGDKVVHEFEFKNTGKGDLIIKTVKTSCGCTAAASTKESIAPGETGHIKANFRAGRNSGKVKKAITVVTNDLINPKVKLTISSHIIQEIVTKPKWLNFGTVTKGEITTVALEVSPGVDDFELEVTGAETESPHITTSYKKHDNGKSYVVTATMKQDVPIGRLKGKVIIKTNSTRLPRLSIPFSGKVTGDVVVSRNVLSYGTVSQGRELVRKLILTLRKKDVVIKEVEVTPEYLSADLKPKKKEDLPYREVMVKLDGNAPAGKIMGTLKIHTSSELQPVIEIPVLGVIKERKVRKG